MENGCQQDWMNCTLCRAGREGRDVLRKAQQRKVQWRQPNSGLTNPIEEPVIDMSLDDAFASMMQFMTISSRKCKRYHNSHKQCVSGSAEEKHCLKYHSPHHQSAVISNPLSRPAAVHVDAAPDGDDSDDGYASRRTSSRKKVRNGKRVKEKGAALDVIRDLIIDSPLISKDAKEEHLTEEYTVKLCLRLIENTKREIRDYRGGPSQIPLPLAHK